MVWVKLPFRRSWKDDAVISLTFAYFSSLNAPNFCYFHNIIMKQSKHVKAYGKSMLCRKGTASFISGNFYSDVRAC